MTRFYSAVYVARYDTNNGIMKDVAWSCDRHRSKSEIVNEKFNLITGFARKEFFKYIIYKEINF